MHDVIVIGCGIVGAAVAYELSRYRLSVTVLEKENDVACGTTKANSAILHAGYDPEPGTLMAKLNVEGVSLASELCAKLDVPHKRCGALVAAFSDEELPVLRELYQRGTKNGVPGLELLDGDKARQLEPGLSMDVTGVLSAPSAMVVSPWEYALALAETAVRNGTQLFLECEVQSVARIEGGWRVQTNRGVFEAKYVLNAAGIHAEAIHNMAAEPSFETIPDRGEYYLLDKSEGCRVNHVIFQCPTKAGKGTLVAPTVHGNLIVGPNNEPACDGEDTATTLEGLAEIAERAKKSIPDIDFRTNIRNFAGVRATTDIDDFIIKESVPGLIDIAGIKSPGLTAAPAIAKMVAEMLAKSGLVLEEKDHFHNTRKQVRFAKLSNEEKNALIRENPAYGRVVCRCETVTEGEILASLSTPIPPKTVDAVKRRVGAGLGRCQGGFCGPRIVSILSEYLGIPPTDILQDGTGSHILTGETKAVQCDDRGGTHAV